MRINHIDFSFPADGGEVTVEIIRHDNRGVADDCIEVRVDYGIDRGTKFYDGEMLPELASRLAGLDCNFKKDVASRATAKWEKFLEQFEI